MTYRKVCATINELFGNLELSKAEAAAKLRKAARYANRLARFLEDEVNRDTIKFPRAA